jgi:hypothetical protein
VFHVKHSVVYFEWVDHILDLYGIRYHDAYKLAWLAIAAILSLGKLALILPPRLPLWRSAFLAVSAAGLLRGTHAWGITMEAISAGLGLFACAEAIALLDNRWFVRRPLLWGSALFGTALALAVLRMLPVYPDYPPALYWARLYPAAACFGGCLGALVMPTGASRFPLAWLGLWFGAVTFAGLQQDMTIAEWFGLAFAGQAVEALCVVGWWRSGGDQVSQRRKLAA